MDDTQTTPPIPSDDVPSLEGLDLQGVEVPQEPQEPTEPQQPASPTEPTKPNEILYDTRWTDEKTQRQYGSVYNSVEELIKGTQEKDRLNERLMRWARRVNEEKERMEAALRKYEGGGQPKPTPIEPVRPQTPIPTRDTYKLPQSVAEQFAEPEVAEAFEKSIADHFRLVDERLSGTKTEPEQLVSRVVQIMEEQNKQNQLLRDLDSLCKENPEMYPPIDMAIAALKDPENPMYDKAMTLNRVSVLAEILGSVQEAHKFVAFEAGQLDAKKSADAVREEGRKQGRAELLKELQDRGARLVRKPDLPTQPFDFTQATQEERHNAQRNMLAELNLDELTEPR